MKMKNYCSKITENQLLKSLFNHRFPYFITEIFIETMSMNHTDKPADLVVKTFHLGIADMAERPETDDAVEFVPNGSCHGLQSQDLRFLRQLDSTRKVRVMHQK